MARTRFQGCHRSCWMLGSSAVCSAPPDRARPSRRRAHRERGRHRPDAEHRHRDTNRCRKCPEQCGEYLTGNWRDEHLCNLKFALAFYDTVQERIAASAARLLEAMRALPPAELRDAGEPARPKSANGKAIRGWGE